MNHSLRKNLKLLGDAERSLVPEAARGESLSLPGSTVMLSEVTWKQVV